MTSRMSQRLLRELLVPLVRSWGAQAVRDALGEVELQPTSGSGGRRKPTKSKRKLSPSELVMKTASSAESRSNLIELAHQYEAKTFLPRVGDARHFLEMKGRPSDNLKDRDEAFRKILPVLADMPEDQLRELRNSAAHSGPSRLGPLSDAIGSTGADLRRERDLALRMR